LSCAALGTASATAQFLVVYGGIDQYAEAATGNRDLF
jgi:hypothetical protein